MRAAILITPVESLPHKLSGTDQHVAQLHESYMMMMVMMMMIS
jgi:hypothetical protein